MEEIYRNLIRKHGEQKQTDKAIEEMGELICILMQARNREVSRQDVKEEIADVYHTIKQLMIIWNVTEEFAEKKFRLSIGEPLHYLYMCQKCSQYTNHTYDPSYDSYKCRSCADLENL